MAYEVGSQVIVRRRVRQFPRTNEIKVGTILAFQDRSGKQTPDGDLAVVSLAAPGGRVSKSVVPVESLEPVTDRFKRARVQVNPAFRQIQ